MEVYVSDKPSCVEYISQQINVEYFKQLYVTLGDTTSKLNTITNPKFNLGFVYTREGCCELTTVRQGLAVDWQGCVLSISTFFCIFLFFIT